MQSDPLKTAMYRQISRAMRECRLSGEAACELSDSSFRNATQFLLKMAEHTWGVPCIDVNMMNNYNKTSFLEKVISGSRAPHDYVGVAETYREQRFYAELAVQALSSHPLGPELRRAVDGMRRVLAPDLRSFTRISADAAVKLGPWKFRFGRTGAITSLVGTAGEAWASEAAPLAAFTYSTLNDTEWGPFAFDYLNGHGIDTVTLGAFSKPGSNNFSESRTWQPELESLWRAKDGACVVLAMAMAPRSHSAYGAPTHLFLNVTAIPHGLVIELEEVIAHEDKHHDNLRLIARHQVACA